MNRQNAIIIEDEVPAARLLHSMVSRIRPEWNITILPGSVDDAIAWFASHPHPDLIFLDIQLADGNSFDFLSSAKPSSAIIFTTAYDQYAVRAFTVNSIDYILKPVDEQRLSDAILKYETLQDCGRPLPDDYLATLLDALQPRDKRYRTRFSHLGHRSFLVTSSKRHSLFLLGKQGYFRRYPYRTRAHHRPFIEPVDGATRPGPFLPCQPASHCMHHRH